MVLNSALSSSSGGGSCAGPRAMRVLSGYEWRLTICEVGVLNSPRRERALSALFLDS